MSFEIKINAPAKKYEIAMQSNKMELFEFNFKPTLSCCSHLRECKGCYVFHHPLATSRQITGGELG